MLWCINQERTSTSATSSTSFPIFFLDDFSLEASVFFGALHIINHDCW